MLQKTKNKAYQRYKRSNRSDISKIMSVAYKAFQQHHILKQGYIISDIVLLCSCENICNSEGYFVNKRLAESSGYSKKTVEIFTRRAYKGGLINKDSSINKHAKYYITELGSNVISSFNRIVLNYLEKGVLSYNPEKFKK